MAKTETVKPAVLISVRPEWCEKIASGEKTIEVRKVAPKLEPPFRCFIYCTQSKDALPQAAEMYVRGGGKVIGEFICDKIITVDCDSVAPFDRETEEYIDKETCLTAEQIRIYGHCRCVKGLRITDLEIYEEYRNLWEFTAFNKFCFYRDTGKPVPSSCWACGKCQVRKAPQSYMFVEDETERRKRVEKSIKNLDYYYDHRDEICARKKLRYQNMDPDQKRARLAQIAEYNRKRRAENPGVREKNREAAKNYYYEHREEILSRRKADYARRKNQTTVVKKTTEKEEI